MLKLTKLALINIVVLLMVLFVLEIAARSYVHFFVEGKHFFRENRFVSPWFTAYDTPSPEIVNGDSGLFRHRSQLYPMIKADNTIRLIAVGGSTTLNDRPFQKTGIDYSIALESRLNANTSGPDFEVLNAGSDAYSSAHSLVNIQFRLLDFEPDYILLMHNINDLTANYFQGGATGDYGNKYLAPYFLNPELQATHSVSGLLFQSRLLTRLGIPEMIAAKRSINYTNNIDAGRKIFERNLRHISAICKQNDIELVLLSQPNNMKDFQFEGQADQVIAYNKVVRNVAAQQNVEFIDIFDLFGHEDSNFIDPVHYTPEGIQRFSEILEQHLQPILRTKTRPAAAVNSELPEAA